MTEESGTQEEKVLEEEQGQEPEAKTAESKTEEPKTFDEKYVKALRAENAKYRRQARDTENSIPGRVQQEIQRILYGNQQQGNQQQGNQQQDYQQRQQNQQTRGQVFDPRVDDMLLSQKLNEIKADPYFAELFTDTDDEGRTFEERLLETAVDKQWPIEELDALVFKMEKAKIFGKTKQSAIDETYKSMENKAQSSGEKNVSSGKNVEEGDVDSIDDAANKAMKELGVTDISKTLR